MSQSNPSFDPSTFLSTIGPFNTTTNATDPPDFTFLVDPSWSTPGTEFRSPVAGAPAFEGLYTEWLNRTEFNGTPVPNGPNRPTDEITFADQFDTLIGQWSSTNIDPNNRKIFPSSWADFITQFRTFFGIPNQAATGGHTAISSTNLNSGPAWDGFLQEFKAIMQTDTDWTSLNSNTIAAEFVDSFSAFLKSYPFSPLNIPSVTGQTTGDLQNSREFINEWLHFNTVTAVIRTNTTTSGVLFNTLSGTSSSGFGSVPYTNLLSYEQAFKAFFPNSTDADFTATIQSFQNEVNSDPNNGGYFIPSQQFPRFFDEMKNRLLVQNASQGTIMAGGGPRLAILAQVFQTIIEMVTTIQRVTAISAQRLGFLTNYQQAYTNLISSIPTFLNGQPFSADDTGPINAQLQAFAQNLRSYEDLLTNNSKSLQSNVDGLNEAQNQQANLDTDLLQQMNSLLNTLMH